MIKQMDSEMEMQPMCDTCRVAKALLWCDTCNLMLCEAATCRQPHGGHDVAAMGANEGDEGIIEQQITEEAAFHMLDCLESSAHLVCRRLLSGRVQALANQIYPPTLRRNASTFLDESSAMQPIALNLDISDASFSSNKFSLPDAVWARLGAYSCCIIDGLLSREDALAARQQTLELYGRGDILSEYTNPYDTNRVNSARQDLRVFLRPPSESEDDLTTQQHSSSSNDSVSTTVEGNVTNIFGPLRNAVSRLQLLGRALAKEVTLAERGSSHEFQLAYYGDTGQRYEKHRDGFPHDGSQSMGKGQVARRLTATMYFNDWTPIHKGCLRLHVPVSADARCTTTVDIEPIAGRVVVFLSGAMDHEVLPSAHPRCALAAWYC